MIIFLSFQVCFFLGKVIYGDEAAKVRHAGVIDSAIWTVKQAYHNGLLKAQDEEEFLRNMAEMGVKNIEARTETLLKFNVTIARLLEQAQAQDVPNAIRDMTIENILKQHREFVDKVMKEEFKLSK